MSSLLKRLRRGRRWWAAEFALRAIGTTLLGGACRIALHAQRLLAAGARHQPTPGEFAVCAVAVVVLAGGIALSLFGPALFHEVPVPRGSRWYWSGGPSGE